MSNLQHSPDKISVNDVFAFVEVLAESDPASSKKLIADFKKVITALSKRIKNDYPFAFSNHPRHFVHLFSHAIDEFNVDYARYTVEKCLASNPSGLADLTKAFGQYAFPAIDRPLTTIDFEPGHYYAVYEELLKNKQQLLHVISHILMNFYDNIDEITFVLTSALSNASYADDQFNSNMMQHLKLPYLGRVIGYMPDADWLSHDPDLDSDEYYEHEEFWSEFSNEQRAFLLSPPVLQFVMDHWAEIVQLRREFEQGKSSLWYEAFRAFAFSLHKLGFGLSTLNYVGGDDFGVANVISRLVCDNPYASSSGAKFSLVRPDNVTDHVMTIIEKYQSLARDYRADFHLEIADLLVEPTLQGSEYISFRAVIFRAESGERLSFGDPSADDFLQQIRLFVAELSESIGIKIYVDTYRDTWLQLTFENKWFRNFPTEKFELETALQFYDSARRPGQKVMLCEFAFAELNMTEGKLDFDDYDVDY